MYIYVSVVCLPCIKYTRIHDTPYKKSCTGCPDSGMVGTVSYTASCTGVGAPRKNFCMEYPHVLITIYVIKVISIGFLNCVCVGSYVMLSLVKKPAVYMTHCTKTCTSCPGAGMVFDIVCPESYVVSCGPRNSI